MPVRLSFLFAYADKEPDIDLQTFLDLLPAFLKDAIDQHLKIKQDALAKEDAFFDLQSNGVTADYQHSQASARVLL